MGTHLPVNVPIDRDIEQGRQVQAERQDDDGIRHAEQETSAPEPTASNRWFSDQSETAQITH